MCYFISVAVPERLAGQLAAALPRNLVLHESRNASITHSLPDGFRLFVLRLGPCSCGLFREASERESIEQTRTRLRKKFEKRKWSNARIERAIESSVRSHKLDSVPAGFADSVREFVAEFVESHDQIRIIAHWYDGDVESELIPIAGSSTVSSSGFLDNQFDAKADWIICVNPDK